MTPLTAAPVCGVRPTSGCSSCSLALGPWTRYCTVLYRTVPYRTVPYRTLPYPTVPYRTVLYQAVQLARRLKAEDNLHLPHFYDLLGELVERQFATPQYGSYQQQQQYPPLAYTFNPQVDTT